MAAQVQKNKELFEELPIIKSVKAFVIPSLASTLITIIYSLADTLFVGHINDPNQLAGLTVAFPYYQLLNAFASLWGVGASSVISRALGEKKYDKASRASYQGFWGSLIFMVIVCLIFFFLMNPLLRLAGGTENSMDAARGYMLICIVLGGIPTVLSIVFSHLMRSEGHAKKASFGLMLGGGLNVILDPVFIFVFHMGVNGAAIATAISNVVSLIYFIINYQRIKADSYVKLSPAEMRNLESEEKPLKELVLVGLPSCCLTILGVMGCITQTHLYSLYSDACVSGWGVTNRISFISIYMTHGVGQGLLPLIGYNYGARNYDRTRSAIKWAYGIMLVIAILIMALSEIFAPGIMRVFTADGATITAGTMIMRIYMLCTPFMGIILMTSTLFQALGKWQFSLGLLAARQLLTNIPGTILLHHLFKLKGVPAGQPVTDFIWMILAIVMYKVFMSKMLKEK